MRILVVGAGAVGGYFGGRLVQAGRDVTFLVRPNRAAQLESAGLRIVSPTHGDLLVRPKAISAAEIAAPYDAILLSVKSYSLDAAMTDFGPAVGPETMVVPVLNGMRHMDVLAAKFRPEHVVGGVCIVATEVDAQGQIVQLADFQSLSYGELDGKETPLITALHGAFSGAGFESAISSDILREMWQKWVLLATLGAITCLLHGNVGEIATAPGGAELSPAALAECVRISAACGYQLPDKFLEEKKAQLSAAGSTLTSSMYRDLQKQAPVEADTIAGALVERGHQHQIAAPILHAAQISLSIYQRARTRRA